MDTSAQADERQDGEDHNDQANEVNDLISSSLPLWRRLRPPVGEQQTFHIEGRFRNTEMPGMRRPSRKIEVLIFP
jgi:hypothetical protein